MSAFDESQLSLSLLSLSLAAGRRCSVSLILVGLTQKSVGVKEQQKHLRLTLIPY